MSGKGKRGDAGRERLFSVTLKDCVVQDFSAGGPGGQHQNTSNTGIRVIHPPSGARGESREERSQLQNKKAAFTRMASTQVFRQWCQRQVLGVITPEEKVKRDMAPENLLVYGYQDGRLRLLSGYGHGEGIPLGE